MSGHRKTALVALAAASMGCSVWLSPAAFAGQASAWNGPYLLTFAANQKTGTSMAARQPETAQRASYSFTSSCSTGVCVATVNDAPSPKNQYMQQSVQYGWNGSQWVQQMNRTWDCPLLGGPCGTRPGEVHNGLDARPQRRTDRRVSHRYRQRRV
jgi:hypothetical protein